MKNEKECLEANYYKKNVKIISVIDFVFSIFWILFMQLLTGSSKKSLTTSLLSILIANVVLLLPLISYNLYKYFYVKKRVKQMKVYSVKFSNIETSFFHKRSVYFTVDILLESGGTVQAKTKPMFSTSLLGALNLNLYKNQIMEVGYDYEKDELIVIGIKR